VGAYGILSSLLESGGVSSGGVRLVDAEEATKATKSSRLVASSASTRLTPPLLTLPISSKLLTIPYAAVVILVAPDDGRIRPKHVQLSHLLQ
jgi:hypothetical protein